MPGSGAGTGLSAIIDLLRTHTAHDFALYKEGTLLRQIERRMAMASIRRPRSLCRARSVTILEEIDHLAKDMLINVTQFFRDQKTFEILAERIRSRADPAAAAGPGRCASGTPAAAPARRPIR